MPSLAACTQHMTFPAGCFCPDGLVEHDGRCINATKCPEEPPPCPEGKVYQKCGTACDNKDDIVTMLQCQVARLGTFSCSVGKGSMAEAEKVSDSFCPSYVRVMSENSVHKLLKDYARQRHRCWCPRLHTVPDQDPTTIATPIKVPRFPSLTYPYLHLSHAVSRV